MNFQNAEEKGILSRILDLAEQVLKTQQVLVTDFYEPNYLELGQEALKRYSDLKISFVGGYSGAERQRIVIFPDYIDAEAIPQLVDIVNLKGGKNFHLLKHRDFLGAVLGLGIRREKIGDILVGEGICSIVAAKDLAPYIQSNLSRVGSVQVQAELGIISEESLVKKFKLINTTVSALRLDAVSCQGFGLSRSQMVNEIKSGKLKVNWKENSKVDFTVKEGDVISCRGKGRIIIEEIVGLTKKGRYSIVLRRLL
ncbi:YlmH/Sll1252 family protein [Bacillota bacterium LX-D]|nr:YlmH/Sll1252 family protein [Bacillota bacterium LX-D]